MHKSLNAILALATVVGIIIAMLAFCGIFSIPPVLSILLVGLGIADVINGLYCYRHEERNECKIFLLGGLFLAIVVGLLTGNIFGAASLKK